MKKIYHSIPVGVLLRTFSIILGFFMVFEAAHASSYANLNEFADYEFSIAENTPSGTVIGEVSVSNAEAFTIIDGNEEGFFEINELTGELSIGEGAGLDYETKASFTLTVEVSTDIGTSVVVVTIHLLDVGGPEALTGEAFDITEEGASLSGTFMDNGNHTVAAIQYGATAQLDDSFNPEGAEGMVAAEAGAGGTSLQLHLTGLEDATTYYYRTVAKNQEGVAFGETKSFTTCTIPLVEQIAIMDQNPTNSDLVHFLVTFSEPIEAATLNENDFELELITYENGSPLDGNIVEILPEDDEGKRYVVKVGLNDGDGSLKLIFRDDDSVESVACGVPVGGSGAENGDFEDGEIYTIDNTAPTTMTILYTNEDVPVTYDFALSDLPDNDDNLRVEFVSLNPELIPDSDSGYEFSGTGNRRKIKIIPVAHKHGEGIVQVTLVDGVGNEGNTKELYIVVRAVADPPLLVANDVSGDEDTGIPMDVSVSLADQDESEVIKSNSISISGLPFGASLSAGTDAGNGKYIFEDAALLADVEFIPSANLSGTYELTLSAISRELEPDGELVARREATATATFAVTVNAVNDEPVFALDPSALTLEEDFEDERYVKILPGLVPADEQGQDVNYSVAPQDNEDPIAHVSIGADESGNPRVVITAKENAIGSQVFVVTANDGQSENNIHEEEFTLVVNPVNDAPAFTLSEDRIEREEDFETTVTVMLTDESPENESDQHIEYSLSPESVDFANISIDAETGAISISSVADRFGSQVFTVTANDGQGENNTHEEEFTLVINPVNDAPVFTLSEDRVEREEDFEGTVTVTLADESPENESDQDITYSLSPESVDFANISIDAETGAISISSVADRFGSQVFTVTANDGQEENHTYTLEFTLVVNPVNDAPAFTLSEDRIEREEDFEGTVTVTLTDESPENESDQRIEYSLSPESVDFANISIDAETGTITITSVPDGFGSQVFTVTANDGQGENNTHEEEFTLLINPVNDAPAFTLSENRIEREEDFEGTVTVTLADESPENESDQRIAYSLSPESVDFADISINAETGTISITSVPDGFGSQVFTVTANDGQGENNTHEEEFTLVINPVNDAPAFTLSENRIEREEDFEGTVTVTLADESPENESGQHMVYSLSPESVDFANISIDAETGAITITSVPEGFGSQVFTVTANDGQSVNNTHEEEFTLVINPANDAPAFTLSEDRIEREEDFEGTVTVTLADESPENESDQRIEYSLSPESVDFANISIDAETGTLSISSLQDRFGSQVFTVTANDGQEENHTYTREFNLVVNPVNDAPAFTLFPEEVIVNEDFTTEEKVVPELELPFPWGEENETVSYSLRNADIDWANITLDPVSGIVTITAVENGNGEQIIELVATDNGTPAPAEYVQTFLLRVIPVNDEPVLAGELEDLEIYEDEPWEYSIPEGVFTDPDGDETLTFSASMESGEELPVWLSFDAASKSFSGTPDGPDVGEYQLLVKATDPEGVSIQDDFTLTVIEVNDIPEISAIADVTVDLGDPVEPITFSISDEETAAAELIVTVAADNGALLPESAMVLSGEAENRKLFITPPYEEWGSAVVTVTVSDGEGEASSEFTFTVNLKTLALDIPDLITPNGDQANDTWNIRYLSLYDNNEVKVFDHTGKIVFGARNYSEAREWDGTHNGRHLPEGVYFYEIKLNNGSINKRGTVTIAR